jgi:hypothetical protein
MIQHFNDILTYVFEIMIIGKVPLEGLLRFSMPPQIQEQYVVLLFKTLDLAKPNRRTTTSPMDESYPLVRLIVSICFIVKQ